jgi:hypothetical protein
MGLHVYSALKAAVLWPNIWRRCTEDEAASLLARTIGQRVE